MANLCAMAQWTSTVSSRMQEVFGGGPAQVGLTYITICRHVPVGSNRPLIMDDTSSHRPRASQLLSGAQGKRKPSLLTFFRSPNSMTSHPSEVRGRLRLILNDPTCAWKSCGLPYLAASVPLAPKGPKRLGVRPRSSKKHRP